MVLFRQIVQGNSQHRRGVRRGADAHRKSHFNQDSGTGSAGHHLPIFSDGQFTIGSPFTLPISLLPLLRHKNRWNKLSTTSSFPPLSPHRPVSHPFLSDFLRFRFLLSCSRKDYKVPSKFYYSIDEVVDKLPPEDNQFPFAGSLSVYYLDRLYPPFNTFPFGFFKLDTNMATTRPQFEEVFTNVIVPELIAEVRKTQISENAVQWIERNFLHNTLGGKYNRGMTVPDTYRLLLGKETLSLAEYKLSSILGWCTELLQAMFLVADDIMDSSKTRRGSPCWYLMEGVGNIAINDSFLLESSIYVLLKKYFKGTDYYIDLLELFHDVTWKTELGQLVDLLASPEDTIDLNLFNYDKYYFIVRYKTAFYSFYLPVALAMHQAGIATPGNLTRARDVLIPLGEYFQVQDDFLDCYGNPDYIGKIGTDILDNKCGWLVNKALELVTPEQRKLLEDNYGQKNAAAEKKVKDLYLELGLEDHYRRYEAESIAMVKGLIDGVDESEGLKRSVLEGFLNKIAGRDK